MNLKERLAALKKRAEELMPRVGAGEADAMKEAEALAAEIEETKAAIKRAEEFEATLKGIGEMGKKSPEGAHPRTLGEFAAEGLKGYKLSGKFSVSLGEFEGAKAAGDAQVRPAAVSSALSDVEERLYEAPRRRLMIADLLGHETTTRPSVTYFVESPTVEGAVASVAEGARKPSLHFGDPVSVTEKVQKIAAVLKETDEIVDDLPWLATSINNRGIYLVQLEEENQLLNGTGTGNDLKGILRREGILSEQTAKGEPNVADALFRAMTKVSNESPYSPDGIVINPADYQTLRLAKDGNSQYYGGGFFAGQYGAGGVMEHPPIWGLRTVVTSAIAAGTVLVGAFRQGASVIRRDGLSVEIANQNGDDFEYNRISIRIEERLALAVRYPASFCAVTVAAAAK